ncbi:uncharacterized protein PFL1_06240 [Pseudozyma flocculosa PF-1]|uniref:CRAL-TRIO domain-containing protein n=1 Tax=Pseudozyma flocculosa PF-1 TaxID=1277687 RepID=A0A061H373_9BASI|nr:uncharacterized protein PFL1_06240 [Pseudozyma flocculosa PF-1]EPQ26305.1 hypothetical protein PFL1_06240 [Pseudozyma flocculosa PF-1]
MVTEIPQKDIEIQEGYVGNLTQEQEVKLRELWTKFFETCDQAADKGDPEAAARRKAAGGDLGGWDEKKSGPEGAGIPKDDAAKDELKAREEQAALDELLNQYGGAALRDTFWKFVKADNPDTDVLRFLRARKWDVSRAFAMMAGCMKWRLDNDVESLVENGDLGNASIEKFLDQQRSGKTYALGTTDNEQPICYIHVKKHLTWGQPGASMSKYVIYAMESFRLLMVPPNDKVVLLFDLTGFGLRNMDWNCILFIVKCLEAYYPESLGTLYIHNAPWIFSGIWKLLGPMLDPAVRSKVKFTKKPADIELVPKERLAAIMGGDNVKEFEFVEPVEGENAKVHDQEGRKRVEDAYMAHAKEYEDVTRKWIQTQGQDNDVVRQRDLLVKKLRLAYFEMDPYVRGLTVYHRNGVLDGQGIVTWEYEHKDGELFRHIVGKKYCAEALRMQIKDIEGGADPVEAEEKAEKQFHEVTEAPKDAARRAVDADTDKVQQHDAHAAKAIEAALAKDDKRDAEKKANGGAASITTQDVDSTDTSATAVHDDAGAGAGSKMSKTGGSIKKKTFSMGSKLKAVVSPNKA